MHEERLDCCLEKFQAIIAGVKFAPQERERVLDGLAENGMAAIQESFKSKEGNLLLYRHFRRLHRCLRFRIANMLPEEGNEES